MTTYANKVKQYGNLNSLTEEQVFLSASIWAEISKASLEEDYMLYMQYGYVPNYVRAYVDSEVMLLVD